MKTAAILFLVATLLNSTYGFAAVAVCTAQCDTITTYSEPHSSGKESGDVRTVQETRTSIVQGVGKNVRQAFQKLSSKCSGKLYVGKTELHESDYTVATTENSCDIG